MKKIISLLSIVLLVSSFGMANDSASATNESNIAVVIEKAVLKGCVKDEITGEELTGVKISIVGTDIVTYSDFDGSFKFKNLQPGKYQLETSYISYKKKTIVDYMLKSKAEQNINVLLKNLVD